MANEESFHSLGEDRTSDLSANRKRKSKGTVENGRSGKSRRWCLIYSCIKQAFFSSQHVALPVQHHPTMLDSTKLDDVGSVWLGLKGHIYAKYMNFS